MVTAQSNSKRQPALKNVLHMQIYAVEPVDLEHSLESALRKSDEGIILKAPVGTEETRRAEKMSRIKEDIIHVVAWADAQPI